MNCKDMMAMPELDGVLGLKAGEAGLGRSIRWIYFADCLQCVQSEYRMEDYIHGGEFVILTNRSVTDDREKLMDLIGRMNDYGIAALGINEGQISPALERYCDRNRLPLFELPERFPLIDLSQIMCKRLVLEENNKNLEEQVFASILDAEHLNRESVLAQARYLNIDLSGSFCVAEFAFAAENDVDGDSLTTGQNIKNVIETAFSSTAAARPLILPQTGSVLALVSTDKTDKTAITALLRNVVESAKKIYGIDVRAGAGSSADYLEDVRVSRREAAAAIKAAELTDSAEHIHFYEDQGFYTLISKIDDGRFLDGYVERYIGRLIRADELSGGNLCETLESYLEHNCSAKDTAEALFIHRNTLSYRMNKIREILGRDIDDIDSCMLLRSAFMIRNFRGIVHRAQKI